jgi:hypothetical protein
MKKNYPNVVLNAFLFVFLFLTGLAVQAQNPVSGKIEVVRNGNNALVLKLSLQATAKKIGSSTIIFSYNKNVISLAEDPKPAGTNNVENGDYYYNPAFLINSDYLRKDITRKIESEGDPGEIRYTYANIDYAFPAPSTAVSINSWTEIATLKFSIVGTGSANIAFLLDPDEMILTDDNGTGNQFDLDPANFYVPTINVFYLTPELNLTSAGIGTAANPFQVYLKSNDTNQKPAGTTGFYIYYNDQEVNFVSATDKLSTGAFGWNNSPVNVEIIDDITKGGGVLFNRRIVYTNNDGNQGNDNWPASNATSAETVLSVIFDPNPLDEDPGFKIYLEPMNEFAHKNPAEDYIYPFTVPVPLRNVGFNDPLPVSLVSFNANLSDKNEVLLKWGTSSEKNNEKFEIERSPDGREFQTILSQKGHGTTTEFHTYAAIDEKPLASISYYRLKQVDYNGETSYSKAVTINNSSRLKDLVINAVYPNPTKGSSTLNFSLNTNNKVKLEITNVLGQLVSMMEIDGKAGRNDILLTGFKSLPGGVYFINLQNGNQKAVHKLIKD